MIKFRSTNPYLHALVRFLYKASRQYHARIWRYVADLLQRPRRKRIIVNVGKIAALTKPGDVVVVPGKVLGGGRELKHPVTVAAWRFSWSAKEKIERAGGKAISIQELVQMNPKGSNVKIII